MNKSAIKTTKPASLRFSVLLSLLLTCHVAQAQSPVCGSPFNPMPVLQPVLPSASFSQSDAAVDCYMWQTFIYLTWPAKAGQAGQPDPNASYGKGGATVWETFRQFDTVFLPNGQKPLPWNSGTLMRATKKPRVLKNTSKMFRALSTAESTALDETQQAGGGVLIDQNGQTVYYEMSMNQTEFNYITTNTLYEANQQNAYAQNTGIVLPPDSIEIKAAWKVLSTQEANATPPRFHTTLALLPNQPKAVTMGLVGLHIMVVPSATNFNQGFWATFKQVDNAPLAGAAGQGPYSFYNPACSPANCPVNVQTKAPTPTQVQQVFDAPPEAQGVNTYIAQMIASSSTPSAVWQNYQLIDVQWPTSPQSIQGPGKKPPLPNGTPNTNTLMNPVLETFLQQQNLSCLTCHTGASTAKAQGFPGFASGYSFLFGHAKPNQ